MVKTLFARILIVYLIVILMAFSLLGGIFFEMLKSQYIDAQMDAMVIKAYEINEWNADFFNGNITDMQFCVKLTRKAQDENVVIWLLSSSLNHVYMVADPDKKCSINEKFSSVVTKDILRETQQGMIIKQVSNMDGSFKGSVMSVALPMTAGDNIIGAIVVNKEVEAVELGISTIFREVLLPLVISVAFAFALAFVLSRYIVRPVKDISAGAKELARGNLDWRVKPTTNDEIGELAVSFNKMAEELKIQEGLRNTFIANVSHELRTPLASVQGFIQGMLDRAIEESERDKYLEIVLTETKRMNMLISDLLSLAKIESGKFPVEYSEFDVNELLRRCILMFEQRIEEKHLQVSLGIGEDKLFVWADEDRISQVITNLVDNAVKFSLDGGQISVWTRVEGNKVKISVSDTGVGIPAEDQPFIFERFFKVDKSHSKATPGTGIGLSIVKRIIAQHGEKISFESTRGSGATFTFTLTRALPKRK
ncbi:MAG: ATP-binding protein [Christensenellales bacterium]